MPYDSIPTTRETLGLSASCSEFQYTYQSITVYNNLNALSYNNSRGQGREMEGTGGMKRGEGH